MKEINVAVVGATGLVGRKIVQVLEERNFPVKNLVPLASARSEGKKISFRGGEVEVQVLDETSFDFGIDLALFAAGGSVSEKYIPLALERGVKVVDNSSFFRMTEGVPLIVPEVNGNFLGKDDRFIANPNCSTIQSVVALKPIYEKFGIKRIVYSSYQAVSGGGKLALEDLKNGTANKWKYPISNNLLAQIDVFLDNGYTKEEMKMIEETRKIFDDQDLRITATCVRVPVENSHGVSINVETERPFEMEEVFEAFRGAEGLEVQDDIKNEVYPLPREATGTDTVYVGRIRRDESQENTLNFRVVADNIRKGAATNAVQNAELLLEED